MNVDVSEYDLSLRHGHEQPEIMRRDSSIQEIFQGDRSAEGDMKEIVRERAT